MTEMDQVPRNPKIYHITHIDNLSGIIAESGLWSDAQRIQRMLGNFNIGMNTIKQRRLSTLQVDCFTDNPFVGQFIPFYYCPRSIMLYMIHRGNHPDLPDSPGQTPIIHLVSSVSQAVQWTESNSKRWAFTDTNAGASYALFYNDLEKLSEVDWQAVEARDFRNPQIKEGKQAEFLIEEFFDFSCIQEIGVYNNDIGQRVRQVIDDTDYTLEVRTHKDWYY